MKKKNKKKNVFKLRSLLSRFLKPRPIHPSKKRKRLANRVNNKKKKQLIDIEEEEEEEEEASPIVQKDPDQGVSPLVEKYWYQRYDLFSLYDHGIKLDEQGWFSVTPEEIAIGHAGRASGGTVIDCFAGVGGNAIQFAKRCYHVVAIDIDPRKIELALNNARIYGVEDCIDFVVGDFFQLAPSLKGDVAFLSPPWGGPNYKCVGNFTLDLLQPKDGHSIFQEAQKITPNIIMFLPRNVDLNQVEELSWLSSPPLNVEVEENYVRGRLKGITAYFGNIASVPAIEP